MARYSAALAATGRAVAASAAGASGSTEQKYPSDCGPGEGHASTGRRWDINT